VYAYRKGCSPLEMWLKSRWDGGGQRGVMGGFCGVVLYSTYVSTEYPAILGGSRLDWVRIRGE